MYFNPRTPVGCDNHHRTPYPTSANFNPRTPVGCDQHQRDHRLSLSISIHAPQWGATPNVSPSFSRSAFQSTHPSGVRLLIGELAKILKQFQSTHPSGVRPCPVPHVVPTTIFQSTHPSGVRRLLPFSMVMAVTISIHAPQWGATRTGPGRYHRLSISIHAPQWGATWSVLSSVVAG